MLVLLAVILAKLGLLLCKGCCDTHQKNKQKACDIPENAEDRMIQGVGAVAEVVQHVPVKGDHKHNSDTAEEVDLLDAVGDGFGVECHWEGQLSVVG